MKFLTILVLGAALAVAQTKPADAFTVWWTQFQAAVKRGDVSVVAAKISYPMQWEDGPTRDVKSEAGFLARFNFYFTEEIKRTIASQKPVRENGMTYTITWKARGNEYSLYFKDRGKGFALDGLSEGPP